MNGIEGRVIVITGASSGMGEAAARHLAAQGARVVLGARRAESAKQYLIARGIPASRIRTISYGKERPVAVCNDISCWSQNRRAVTVVPGGQS